MIENARRIATAINDIKNAIISKGVTPTGKVETFAQAITDIPAGVDVSDTTATPDSVIKDEVFYDSNGEKQKGNLPLYNNSAPGDFFDLGRIEDLSTINDGYLKTIIPERCAIGSDAVGKAYLPHGFTLGNADVNSVLEDVYFSSIDGINIKGKLPIIADKTISVEVGKPRIINDGCYRNVTIMAQGTRVATGTFISTTSGYTVDCGFAPKKIFVSNNYTGSTYNELGAWIDGGYSGARGAGANSGGNITTSTITVSGNTFTHKAYTANFANKPAFYIAVG